MSEQEKERHYATMTEAEKAAWDAEIETDYERVQATTKRPGKLRHGRRLIGAPREFWIAVRSHTLNSAALTVATYVYHRTTVCRCRTVKLVGSELAELRVDRSGRHKALRILAAAGLVRLHRAPSGSASMVELLWKPSPDSNGGVAK